MRHQALMDIRAEFVAKNKAVEHKYAEAFQETFGVPLRNFIDNLTGFNILAFDAKMKPPEGQSLADYLTEKYGESATKLVEAIIFSVLDVIEDAVPELM